VREGRATMPAATVSPVLVGEDRAQWYKVIVGAFATSAAADSLRARLSANKTVAPPTGAMEVVRTPLAFLLDSAVAKTEAPTRVGDYLARGIAAYALARDDGKANIYVGAFATPDDAALLASQLKSQNIQTTLAYRVGSVF
jgi:hypothetical protein